MVAREAVALKTRGRRPYPCYPSGKDCDRDNATIHLADGLLTIVLVSGFSKSVQSLLCGVRSCSRKGENVVALRLRFPRLESHRLRAPTR
jgi:hypothetical protein